ncbi:MAG: sodium:solute symporter [Crocinitomicaceae bacterium]|nr:sodium:solute symporter [Crocinitomicaceae bacterium]
MSTTLIVIVLVLYFAVLVGISYLTSRKANNESFFRGDKKSPWYLVSFGMIGASLSGVTFLSIPGWVGDATKQFSYMQVVFGYLVGYFIVAYVLLPLFYKSNVTSIYEYLKDRFGFWSYKTGAFFFLISRVIGASIRLLLVANVLQSILFDDWGIPFEITVVISILLIWIYTSRGGIKTIVWTDTLQTLFMLSSVILTVYFISDALNLSEQGGVIKTVSESKYSQMFFFDDFLAGNNFWKSFFGGMFITIGMTGLDQDMMQKNLSCRNIGDAQKNMISMAIVLVVVNLVFLALGSLLYMYAEANMPEVVQQIADKELGGDMLFSTIAMSDAVGPLVGVLFLLGLVAAAYSSADSALTSLTTSFSIDFLNLKRMRRAEQERTRRMVHVGMSVVLVLVIILLKYTTNESAIWLLLKFAGFTYGPLIGMFFFGIIFKRTVRDGLVPIICFVSILLMVLLWYFSFGGPGVAEGQPGLFGNYAFGIEMIIINSFFTFIGMLAFSKKKSTETI